MKLYFGLYEIPVSRNWTDSSDGLEEVHMEFNSIYPLVSCHILCTERGHATLKGHPNINIHYVQLKVTLL
jgi:hypothetical protein